VISPETDVLRKPETQESGADGRMHVRSRSENCARIKNLGFTASRHVRMYGESFEIVSDPFNEGDCVAVHAIGGNDPKVRTLRLPITILVGSEDRFLKRRSVTG
jgi:hypothetical protein